MIWIIASFFAGVLFTLIVFSGYIFYQGIKGLEEAHRDGWDNPFN